MERKPSTLTVRGRKVSNRSNRRWIVVAVRAEDVTIRAEDEAHRIFGRAVGTYVAFAEVIARSDSIATARKRAERYGRSVGTVVVVVDSTTGEEV